MDQITADYKACKSGDKDAAIRLYQSMKNILLTTAFGILRERSAAEDIVHDVFLQVLQSDDDCDIRNAKAYMIRMVRNKAIDYARKESRNISVEGYDEMPAREGSQENIPTEDFADMEQLLSRLDGKEADAVRLRVIAEMRFRDIAQAMSVSVTTAFRLYRSGISKLRKWVK
jgi:RNA polymerase sigma-70 factor (ECF subfamily)